MVYKWKQVAAKKRYNPTVSLRTANDASNPLAPSAPDDPGDQSDDDDELIQLIND